MLYRIFLSKVNEEVSIARWEQLKSNFSCAPQLLQVGGYDTNSTIQRINGAASRRLVHPYPILFDNSTLIPMPRATTEKFSRAHQPAPKKKESQSSGSNTNPLFNTARFGQHILKNPATAQKSDSYTSSEVFFFSLIKNYWR